jgi:hypothetical protein
MPDNIRIGFAEVNSAALEAESLAKEFDCARCIGLAQIGDDFVAHRVLLALDTYLYSLIRIGD